MLINDILMLLLQLFVSNPLTVFKKGGVNSDVGMCKIIKYLLVITRSSEIL